MFCGWFVFVLCPCLCSRYGRFELSIASPCSRSMAGPKDSALMQDLEGAEALVQQLESIGVSDPSFARQSRSLQNTCTKLLVCQASSRTIFKLECGTRTIDTIVKLAVLVQDS